MNLNFQIIFSSISIEQVYFDYLFHGAPLYFFAVLNACTLKASYDSYSKVTFLLGTLGFQFEDVVLTI